LSCALKAWTFDDPGAARTIAITSTNGRRIGHDQSSRGDGSSLRRGRVATGEESSVCDGGRKSEGPRLAQRGLASHRRRIRVAPRESRNDRQAWLTIGEAPGACPLNLLLQ